jgi:hypothetical protein
VTLTGGQTLTNKTLTAPTINNPVIPATEFANADHAHAAANSGGTLDATNCLGATIVPVANGGTGMAGYTAAGRIVYSNGAASLTALAVGTAGKTLRVNVGATAPEWANARLAPGAVLAFGGTTDVQVSVSQGQHFLIPATDGGAATHTISLQLAGAVQGDFMVFTADGAANSQATQYRSVLTNIGGAQTLSKKHGFTAVFNGTAWVCASNYLEP